MTKPQDIPMFTRAQVNVLHRIWIDFFIDGVKEHIGFNIVIESADPILAGDGAIGIMTPGGMYIGIEPDGHTHT